MTKKKPAKPKTPCHVEQSFAVMSRAVHDLTKRLESVEIENANLATTVSRLASEVARLKQPWWRRSP